MAFSARVTGLPSQWLHPTLVTTTRRIPGGRSIARGPSFLNTTSTMLLAETRADSI